MKSILHDSFILTILYFLLLPFFISCTHDPVIIADLDTVCFESQVLPVIQTSCGMSGCHDGSQEGFLAQDYTSIMEAVKPGDPRGSQLYKVITDINGENFMPPDQPLTQLQRSIIQVWIEQGAKETTCNDQPVDTTPVQNKTCFTQDILPMILSSCGVTGCHDAVTHEEGYSFTNYSNIRNAVVPFRPSESKIYEVVNQSGEDRMPPPPRPPLSSDQIAALLKWINDGAQNSDCPPVSCDTSGNITFAQQVSAVLKANCTGCHNSLVANGNVNLTTYNGVLATVQNQRNGTPVLLGSVKRMTGFVAMPPTFKLDACSVATIEKWIALGAPE